METTGKHWQVPMPFLAEVRARQADTGAVRYAIQSSGHDDYEVAEVLGISPGYMSKVVHGTAGLYGNRLVRFMQITGSLAPLQWLAEQMGCDVVQRSSQAARIAALEQELAEAKKAAA